MTKLLFSLLSANLYLQYLCNCDATDGDNNIDDGTLKNKDQLPVIQLNYGGSGGRFSQIKYKLDNLRCAGKSDLAVYPSERDENILDVIENVIRNNTNEVVELKGRTEVRVSVVCPNFKSNF